MNLQAVAIADFMGFLMLIAMLISSHVRRSAKRDEFRIFTMIAIMSAVACVVDFLVFYSDGKEGPLFRVINLLGNTYCFITNPVFVVGWCMYTDLKLYKSRARIRKRYKYVSIPAFILIFAALLNMFVPIVFYMDESNVYHRLPFSYVFYIVEFCYMLYSVALVHKYEERYGKVRFFPIYLMIGPIIVGCVLQAIFYGISLIWISLAIGITAIYMSMQNEFSYLDTLTGLYNRAYLDYLLESHSKDPGSHMGGIMIDVDFFKKINDTFGHSTGDEALIDCARVITLSKPDKAMAVRFAGDEFILIMKDSTDEFMQKVIRDIRDEVDLFNDTEGRQYKLSLSLGYALYDPEKDNIDSFFKHMDDNMYEEKIRKHAKRE
ncbi:GGDEF domain-containing protein [Butyrivibrio sp. VCB2006]|uniref:GGDEF domain-containing protein n=1 Tax=Butyrivibrio sp. VCB2006 TaxID=1280679 RepID=UPI00040DFAA8|nr:GGDEF domain-containing protein [Butyrivibrio sp. VCB2006]